MSFVNLLNITINNISSQELIKNLREGGTVVTPNVDHIIKLQKDPEFHRVYSEADYRVCDSQILIYASKFLGKPIQEKISGSDLFPAFYNHYKEDREVKIFLLGAKEGVARKAQRRINRKVGRKIIVGAHSPSFGFENNEQECQEIINLINQSEATVLAIGVGAPKQEKWIHKYKGQFHKIKTFLAIGATIDFEAGNLQRSPRWMSKSGLEWLYRLGKEPRRLWKRYLVEGLPFFWLVLQQKLNRYTYTSPTGYLLEKAGLISAEQIAEVLQQQATTPELRFGEIVQEKRLLKAETVDFFAERLQKLKDNDEKQPLGQYLKAAALLNENQITTILQEQQDRTLKFGEIAVRKGWIKQQTLDLLLQYLE